MQFFQAITSCSYCWGCTNIKGCFAQWSIMFLLKIKDIMWYFKARKTRRKTCWINKILACWMQHFGLYCIKSRPNRGLRVLVFCNTQKFAVCFSRYVIKIFIENSINNFQAIELKIPLNEPFTGSFMQYFYRFALWWKI